MVEPGAIGRVLRSDERLLVVAPKGCNGLDEVAVSADWRLSAT